MKTFLIISPHTQEDCTKIVKMTLATGYLTHFHWGCKSGEHTGYALIEAENEQEALLAIPTLIRDKARVIGVTQFNPSAVEKW